MISLCEQGIKNGERFFTKPLRLYSDFQYHTPEGHISLISASTPPAVLRSDHFHLPKANITVPSGTTSLARKGIHHCTKCNITASTPLAVLHPDSFHLSKASIAVMMRTSARPCQPTRAKHLLTQCGITCKAQHHAVQRFSA